jgi:hypothetical protein
MQQPLLPERSHITSYLASVSGLITVHSNIHIYVLLIRAGAYTTVPVPSQRLVG